MVGKYLIIIVLLIISLLGCSNNKDIEKINISIKVIDSYTKQPRVGDVIILREIKFGFPMRKSIKVAEQVTNNIGVASFEIKKQFGYIIWAKGINHAFSSTEFEKGTLNDGQQVIIEVVPPDQKQFKIE